MAETVTVQADFLNGADDLEENLGKAGSLF
jgi:hypothetical protein